MAPRIHYCPRHPSTLCVEGWPCHVCEWFDSGQHRATPYLRKLDDDLKAEARKRRRLEKRRQARWEQSLRRHAARRP